MPNKQFELCKVCRLNHNQGRGHRYSARHKQRLAPLLSKALHKIKDVSFFLNNPARLRESDRPLNAFWCTFCEEKISEDSSVFVCSNTIRHLASSTHVETLKKYWYENGADVGKRHLYAFQTEELAKWEDACKALSAASTSRELSPGSVNNIHTECSSSKTTAFEAFSVASFTNSNINTSDPLPLYKDGSYNYHTVQDFDRRSLGDYHSKTCRLIPEMQSLETQVQTSSDICAKNTKQQIGLLTCIRQPSSNPGVGNVHSGAPPPWLQMVDQRHAAAPNSLYTGVPLSRAKERRLKMLSNPKRVGAAWAEKRRVEMQREACGELLQKGLEGGNGWLPNFGSVWQSGSRRETRKEFEAEKRLEKDLEPTTQPDKPKIFQPYISKRQRLEEVASSKS